jgi:hypothetical protein
MALRFRTTAHVLCVGDNREKLAECQPSAVGERRLRTLKMDMLVKVVGACWTLLLVGTVTTCGGGSTAIPLPTPAVRSQPAQARLPLIIQFCDDDTGSFPRQDFNQAKQLISTSLEQAATANQQGVTLFATAITHDTFAPANTLDPAFSIPAIVAYSPTPTLIPTHAPQNPIYDNATASAVYGGNEQSITSYNQSVAKIDNAQKAALAAITNDVGRLASWNPPIDYSATSILGCFQLAGNRFQNTTSIKMIYIASDLENNTDVDYTQSFVSKHELAGAIVHVIYFVSPNATRDQQKRTQWCSLLKAAGASTVLFSDPGASAALTNVFDADLQSHSTAC